MNRHTTQDTLIKACNSLITILQGTTLKTTERTTILLIDNNIMRNVNETTCQVSSIGSLHSRIGKTLTSTVRSNKVLQHRHTLLKVRDNWVLNNLSTFSTSLLWLSHKTTHTSKLCNLISRTTGTRVKHHVYSVETLVSLCHVLHNSLLKIIVYVCPRINYLIITLLISDETHFIVSLHLVNLILTLTYDICLLNWHDDIIEVEGKTSNVSHTITKVLDTIKELTSTRHTNCLNNVSNKTTK